MQTPASAIAVIGLGVRFPGAPDADAFWANLRDGVCSITDFRPEDLLADGATEQEVAAPGFVPAKGHLDGADRFEAELFGLTARQAEVMDPQHRLLLENSWAALEDAGYDPRAVGLTTGVYVGCDESDHMLAALSDPRLSAELGWEQLRRLADKDFPASWITGCLGLSGPGLTVLTACSSSLAAVHLAAQSLLARECDLALAGGAAVDTVRRTGYRHQSGGVASPDGRCRPFDEHAAGTVRGNGAAVVALRRLADALADGDPVRAVILGSALGNDGRDKIGFSAPSVPGQSAVMQEALAVADVPAASVGYIEMHGTATPLGDRIEAAAAAAAYAAGDGDGGGGERGRSGGGGRGTPIAIGSVKSNIGHLDAAAGIAGLAKAVLMLEHGTLAPTVNVRRPHPELGLAEAGFDLVVGTAPWPRPVNGRRRAAVNSAGLGGGNVHVILEEAPDRPAAGGSADQGSTGADQGSTGAEPYRLPISARTEGQLRAAAGALSSALAERPDLSLAEVARTLRYGRAALPVRACVLARDVAEAVEGFAALADGAPLGDGPPTDDSLTDGSPTDGPGRRVHLPTYRFAGQPRGALA